MVGVIVASALFGAVFLMPVFMQEIQGKDTLQTGLLLAPQGLAAAAAMTISGTLSDRFGARWVVFCGVLALVAATLLLTGITPRTDNWSWILITSARGFGMGFAMMPNFAAAYVTLPQAAIARATAVANTLQRISSSFGIAVLATVVEARITAHLPAVHGLAGGAQTVAATTIPPAIRGAAARGFDDTFWLAAGVAALALPATMLLRRPLPEGERLLAESEGRQAQHPPLDARTRFIFAVLLVAALAFFAWTIAKSLNWS